MTMSDPDEPMIVCDLDGVLWRGEIAIPGAADAVRRLRDSGSRVAFLTNNSSVRVTEVLARLVAIGIEAVPDDVLTSAQAAATLLTEDLIPGARVLACAGEGVVEAFTSAGFDVVTNDREVIPEVAAVVVGFHREFDFDRLDRAADAVRRGARFVATNTDPTYPGATRVLPGAGSLVAAVATASGRRPEVAGKPEAATVALVRERFGEHGIMVGDRPSTDGVLAHRLGWPFAMVLSGIGGHDPNEPIPEPRPAWVASDLAEFVDLLRRAQPMTRRGSVPSRWIPGRYRKEPIFRSAEMPQTPNWNRFLDAGAEFVALTRSQARSRAKDLVVQGHLAQSQVQGFVDDLVDESRRRTDTMMDVVRQEIQRQVKVLGIATKDDLARLERKIAGTAARKAPVKKTAAKKTAVKKTAVKKTPAKKTPAKKAPAKKTTAKKTTTRAPRAS